MTYRQEGVTFTHCVPTILHMLLSSPACADVNLSSLKMIIGGSALSKGLCKAAMQKGINIYSGYGMSETCPVLTIAHLKPHMVSLAQEEQIDIRCRTGLPIPLVGLRVVDEEDRDLPHDGSIVGEVVVRSPWLTQGYLRESERSEDLWAGGWLHTSDVVTIDSEDISA